MSEPVVTLDSALVPQVVDVLTESFFDYPVMRFVLGADDGDYEQRLATLIHYFVLARVFRNELMLGVGNPDDLDGAALVSRPEVESPPELAELREDAWAELGNPARERYEECCRAWAPLDVETPNLHINMIGVRRRAQGKGAGRRLIDHIHRLSREDPTSRGVSLTSEEEKYVALYQHLGYEIVGEEVVVPGLRTWGFFRAD